MHTLGIFTPLGFDNLVVVMVALGGTNNLP